MSNRICAVVLTFNSAADLEPCLTALVAARTRGELLIWVVDNGSRDDSVAIAREFASRSSVPVRVIETGANLGYAGGNNHGFAEIMRESERPLAIAVVNPDLRLSANAIDEIAELLAVSPSVGMMSPAVVCDLASPPVAFRPHLGLRRARVTMRAGHRVALVDRLPGACMLIRPDVLATIGGFDERFFLYFEELELCARAARAGWEVVVVMDVLAEHATEREEKPHRLYYLYRNQFLFARLVFSPARAALYIARRQLVNFPRELAAALRGGRYDLAGAMFRGLTAGVRRETGRGHPPGSLVAEPNVSSPGA